MSKSRSKRLQPVRDFAAEKAQQAARELGECKARLEQQRQQLRDLENYHREYAAQINQAGSLSIERYQNMQAFMLNLNKAIEHQRQIIERLEREYEAKKEQWLQARNRGKALDKVVEKYREREREQARRKLQRELDDRAKLPQGGKD